MKKRKTELDVDFIGGQGALTHAEEKALSAFFQQQKSMANPEKQKSTKKNTKTTA